MMAKQEAPKKIRVYVKVVSYFDKTGYLQPSCILWDDGRTYEIEKVTDLRPADMVTNHSGDCYTIVIKGQQRYLFFERVDPAFQGRVGRWFVETSVQKAKVNV